MSRFLFSGYDGLVPYVPGEQPAGGFVKLNTNESPFPPAPEVLSAVSAEELSRLRLYPDPECAGLKDRIARAYGVGRENVYVAGGSDDILSFAFMAFGRRSGAVFPDVSYGFYRVAARLHGVPFREIPVREDFSVDPGDYLGLREMAVIANPNAPTGMALAPGRFGEMAESGPDRVVLVDEAYVDYGAASCVPLTRRYDNLLAVHTFSKSRSLAGARLGFAIGDAGLIRDLETIKYSTNPYNVSRLTLVAGEAAIGAASYYRANCEKIIKTREETASALRALGFEALPSCANFLFVRHRAVEGARLYAELKRRGILVRHFPQERIRSYVRVTVGNGGDMAAFLRAAGEITGGEGVAQG